jgi:hypothetical protein
MMGDLISIVAAVLASLGISTPATPRKQAVRGEQVQIIAPTTTTTVPTFVDNCDEARWYADQHGLPVEFDRIIWRESNCRQEHGVRTSCCVGWLQLNADLHVRDHRLKEPYAVCGVFGNADIDGPEDKWRHMCAAAALWREMGTGPWQ